MYRASDEREAQRIEELAGQTKAQLAGEWQMRGDLMGIEYRGEK